MPVLLTMLGLPYFGHDLDNAGITADITRMYLTQCVEICKMLEAVQDLV